MKIVSWNVNSINARLSNILEFIEKQKPDILLLQEIKTEEKSFPFSEISNLGYNVKIHGQKSYNGVAILSKFPIEDVFTELVPEDDQARYIEAVISLENEAIRVASIYVPNGAEVGSEKFEYKLKFFDKLRERFSSLLKYGEKCVFSGDYNVAPTDMDVYDPVSLKNTLCFHPKEQKKFRELKNLGLFDIFRSLYPDKTAFSWWDYRGGGWQNNKGMRIDQMLLSPEACDSVIDAGIYDEERGKKKASDHAPIFVELENK